MLWSTCMYMHICASGEYQGVLGVSHPRGTTRSRRGGYSYNHFQSDWYVYNLLHVLELANDMLFSILPHL